MKKRIILVACILASLMFIAIYLSAKRNGQSSKYELRNNTLAIMVWDESALKYEKSNDIPIGDYFLSSKSFCKNGSKITSYDNELGVVSYNMNVADECYLYFDIKEYLGQYVMSLVSSSDYTSSQDGSIYRIANQNGVRYEGKDPDNYLTFNGESWRIIGTFDGSDIGLNEGENYTKIVRTESIGLYAWSENADISWNDEYDEGDLGNDWVNSSLYEYLNGTYLNLLSNSNMIANAKWYLRGTDTSSSSTLTSSGWYNIERTTGHAGYRGSTQYGADTETTAKMGLLYPSDYGYAMYGYDYTGEEPFYCDNTNLAVYQYEQYNDDNGVPHHCDIYANWLTLGESCYWSITPAVDTFSNAYFFEDGGYGSMNWIFAMQEFDVYPTLYLKNDVYVTSGNGSLSNPYILNI